MKLKPKTPPRETRKRLYRRHLRSTPKPPSSDPILTPKEARQHLGDLTGWKMREEAGIRRITKVFPFPDFSKAATFARTVGEDADRRDHHPAILLEWGKAAVSWWTHRTGGLHLNDFAMAARTDALAALI